jgi:hypothetical protein
MTATGFDPCPVCARPLAELPAPNRCPECGFNYDADTLVWRSTETWRRVTAVYTAYGLIGGLICAVLYRFGFDEAPYPALPLLLALLVPAAGLFLRRLISGRITGRFVALTPGGVLVGTRPTPQLVPWDDVDRLTEPRGVPKLQRKSSETVIPLDDIFVSAEDLAAFRTALQATLRRRVLNRNPASPQNPNSPRLGK